VRSFHPSWNLERRGPTRPTGTRAASEEVHRREGLASKRTKDRGFVIPGSVSERTTLEENIG
jgi:hypothetical protein